MVMLAKASIRGAKGGGTSGWLLNLLPMKREIEARVLHPRLREGDRWLAGAITQ
jgi:hypothetical protein